MPPKQLDNLARLGKLKIEPGARAEIDGLLRSSSVRLKDAADAELSPDSKFDLVYNAAHAASLAALRWHGFRSESRYLVFQCLEHTLGISSQQWRVLDDAHRKRNLAEYEGDLDIDNALLDALMRIAIEVLEKARALPPLES
jgi:hypothetical protein